jgi:riboflavin transporter FmnP
LNTKKLALIAIFAALTIVLGQLVKFPAPYAPFLYYQIWEIPIMIVFIIISPVAGILISLLNTAVLFVIFPGALITGPLYNLAAILTMQIGVFGTELLIRRISKRKQKQSDTLLYKPKWVAVSTAMGILTRVVGMSIILFYALPQSPPIGFGFDQATTIALLPLEAFFNATVALYTIPIAYLIANRVKKFLRLN